MSFFERMFQSGNESEEARMQREKTATDKAKALSEAEEAEKLIAAIEAKNKGMPKEVVDAGVERALRGAKKRDEHYPEARRDRDENRKAA